MRVSSASAAGSPKSRCGNESVEKVNMGCIGLIMLDGEGGGEGVEAACALARVVMRCAVNCDAVSEMSSPGGDGGAPPFWCGSVVSWICAVPFIIGSMFPFCTTVPLLVGAEPSSDSVRGAPLSCSRSCIATPLVFEVSWASKVTTDIAWTSSGGARRVPFVAGGNVPLVVALELCLLPPMSLSPFGTYRRSPENLENRFFARYSETCSFRETVPAWFVRFVRCLEV